MLSALPCPWDPFSSTDLTVLTVAPSVHEGISQLRVTKFPSCHFFLTSNETVTLPQVSLKNSPLSIDDGHGMYR